MPGTTRELSNSADFPRKSTLNGFEIVPALDSNGQPVGLPTSLLVQDGGVTAGHLLDQANPHGTTKAQVGLGNVDNTADIDKPISNAVSEALLQIGSSISSVDSRFDGLMESLSGILVPMTSLVGQQLDFSGLTNTSIVNSRTYAIPSHPGTLTQIQVFSASTTTIQSRVCTWVFEGGVLTEVASAQVSVAPGYNVFDVSLTVPANGAFGFSSNPSFHVGQNSTIPDTPILYSGNTSSPISGVTTSNTFNAMLAGTVDTVEDQISSAVAGLQALTTIVSDRYGFAGDVSQVSRTSVAGASFAAYPSMTISQSGVLRQVEVLAFGNTTYNLLIWDYDAASGVYTLASSTPIFVNISSGDYNSVEVSVPVQAGQVIGMGGSIGTSSGVPTTQVVYGGVTSGGVTTMTEGVSQVGQFAIVAAFRVERVTIAGTGAVGGAQKTIAVIGHGQSNRRGLGISNLGGASYGNQMFASGLLTQDVSNPNRTLLSAINDVGGTGLAIALGYAVELEMEKNSSSLWTEISRRYFASCPAWSGATIDALTDFDGPYWPVARDDLIAMGRLLDSQGQDARFGAISWVHGYSDRFLERGQYAPKLREAYDRMIGAAGPNIAGRPLLIAAQLPHHKQNAATPSFSTNPPNVALDTRDVALSLGGEIYPIYQVNWQSEGIHMTRSGKIHAALLEGKLLYDMTIGEGFSHVRSVPRGLTGASIILDALGGIGSYVFDTATVPPVPNMGFDVYSSSNVLIPSRITNVSMSSGVITVAMTQALSAGEKLTYGWGRPDMPMPAASGSSPYLLGNLRDSDNRSKTVEGETYNLFNWAAIQEWVR